jgi:microsomal dipeptidase-like Zn-dependent dipeptidase
VVWNATETTLFPHADDVYLAKVKHSGMTAALHTVCVWESAAEAMEVMIGWRRFYERSNLLMLGTKAEDVAQAKRTGRVAMYMAWQDIVPLEGRLDLLDAFYLLGLRFVQPTYQRRNLAGDGCGERVQSGLSIFGVDLVKRCNQLRIGLDVSHVSEATTLDIVEHSTAPVMASHVGARALNDNTRNKTDREIKAIAAKGGLIGIVAKSGFLRPDGLKTGTTLDDYVDHLQYVCDLVGTDHVCIGTDIADERKYSPEFLAWFNSRFPENTIIGSDLNSSKMHPKGLQSPNDLRNITAALVRRGFSDADLRKILGGNMDRVIKHIL